LADKGKILTCGSGAVNIEILVEGRWCPGYLEDVWYVPDIGRGATAGDGDPTSYWEAINSAQEEEWVTAMKEEMDALVENDTREFADRPKNVKVIDKHWVL
jgi:hypothetical protein